MNRITAWYYQQVKPLIIKKPLFYENSEVPFFILSSGRSGSTLLRKLLLENTSVNIPPESNDLIPKLVKFYLKNNHRSWEFIAEKSAEIFNHEIKTTLWKSEITEYRSLMPSQIQDSSLAGLIYSLYTNYSKVHGFQFERWGDKTPFLIFRLGWIKILYPQAQFIYMIRDGRAVVNSYLKLNKGYSLHSAANRWMESLKIYENFIRSKGSKNVLLVRYEDLVSNKDKELEKIYLFLNLQSRKTLNENVFLGDDVLPHHVNLHKNIDMSFINKWEWELSEEEKKFLSKYMEKQLSHFGYN